MDYQEFPADVCDIMYVMGGKLLYEVNSIERWQCIPFMKGIAGSGKSTIVKAFSKFYETLDVKTLLIDSLMHIEQMQGTAYCSTLIIDRNGSEEMFDCRPSDGIAIALRTGATIEIEAEMAKQVNAQKSELDELIDLNTFLEGNIVPL